MQCSLRNYVLNLLIWKKIGFKKHTGWKISCIFNRQSIHFPENDWIWCCWWAMINWWNFILMCSIICYFPWHSNRQICNLHFLTNVIFAKYDLQSLIIILTMSTGTPSNIFLLPIIPDLKIPAWIVSIKGTSACNCEHF